MISPSEVKYIVAVSGGVDSVVLLDMLSKKHPDLIVAHFDHGVREDSADDAVFVGQLAARYGLRFETKREELGKGVSEAMARQRRYEFLRTVARQYKAKIITAHHADDVIETIAINLIRGTGWRGLAVLDNPEIIRPLLGVTKKELITYAQANHLNWHEDSTNTSDRYLRNRLRKKLAAIDDDTRRQLLALRDHEVYVKKMIDDEITALITPGLDERYFFITAPPRVSLELLRAECVRICGKSPLTAQLQRALLAIKTAAAGTRHDVGDGVYLEFTRTNFIVKASDR